MVEVETVRGRVSVDALGTVLMHEHVFVLSEEIWRNYPQVWDEKAGIEDAVTRLQRLKALGVDTIVDPTVIGLGRDIRRIAQVNERVDINIIPATGLYTYGDVPNFFHFRGPGTLLGGDDPMVEMFVNDITVGIAGTPIRAAFLKCAIEEALTPGVERVMRAVAETHRRTGAPIMVHTSAPHHTGLVAKEIFASEGVDLSRLLIAHSGDTTDMDYLHQLLDGGAYVGMDRFGLDILLATDERVSTVAKLAAEGYASQMMLSHDACCEIDWIPRDIRERVTPNWHYTFLHDSVLPALKAAGVTDGQLDTMLVENPKAFFTPEGTN